MYLSRLNISRMININNLKVFPIVFDDAYQTKHITKSKTYTHANARGKRGTPLRPTRLVSWLLLASGLIALAASIVYESYILAFIGLGLTLWGPLLLYMSMEKYVKQTLLDSTILPSLADLDQILTELEYQGKGIYLPPKYFKDFETSKTFIPKSKNTNLPTPEKIRKQEDKIFLKNPEAALISPPGLSLSKLFEKTLGTSFTTVDLEYLRQNLPKLFIEDLEIAEDLEIGIKYGKVSTKMTNSVPPIKTKYDTIQVRITNSVYQDMCRETGKLSRIRDAIGCPICSAIACALAKATGKPVIIEKTEVTEDGKTIETNFRLLGTIESKAPTEVHLAEVSRLLRARLLPNLASLFLTAFGSIILAWVGWLTWYDMTEWGKNIAIIFFGSRAGEAVSMGIGMKVIYHFLIGLASLLTGLLIFLRRRRSEM